MVTVSVSIFDVLLTASVNVLVEVAGSGLKVAVTPAGKAPALRVTF